MNKRTLRGKKILLLTPIAKSGALQEMKMVLGGLERKKRNQGRGSCSSPTGGRQEPAKRPGGFCEGQADGMGPHSGIRSGSECVKGHTSLPGTLKKS